jgi:GNAT superfamily N-acetyltransferase
MDELDTFYGSSPSEPPAERRAAIAETLFGPMPAAYALLAHDGRRVVGLAAYSFLWPAAGVTRSLFLKELFVRLSHQRSGVGTDLMRAICRQAKATNCSRVEWTTEHTNTNALAFYASIGAPVHHDKAFLRLDSDRIDQLAAASGH